MDFYTSRGRYLVWTAAAIFPVLGAVRLANYLVEAEFLHRLLLPFFASCSPGCPDSCDNRQIPRVLGHLSGPKEEPLCPKITASMKSGLCGQNVVSVSRLPVGEVGPASWSLLLALFHNRENNVNKTDGRLIPVQETWLSVPRQPMKYRGGVLLGNPISRTSLITLLLLSNARPTFEFSDASGYRANFASYIGQWYINWPLGKPATITVYAHDSHTPDSDVYPPVFTTRVDRCVEMMAGVVIKASKPSEFALGFPSRVAPGRYLLEFQPKGYSGTHGSRHLYNMNGGKVYDVDFLFMRPITSSVPIADGPLELHLPIVNDGSMVSVYIRAKEQEILAHALDLLPWSSLSWSVHRGLRDVLLAFSKSTMDRHRQALADRIRNVAFENVAKLECMGWESSFVSQRIGDMAHSAILAGRGNSGDMVRIVTCLAELCWDESYEKYDETSFWRKATHDSVANIYLEGETVVALTKCFVLEWSVNFDYQLYHKVPPELFLE